MGVLKCAVPVEAAAVYGPFIVVLLLIVNGAGTYYFFLLGQSNSLWRARSAELGLDTTTTLPITMVLIDYKTWRTLQYTLDSYRRERLHEVISETLLYIQEIQNYPTEQLQKVLTENPFISTVLGSARNTWVHGAILSSVRTARSPFILLVEKDFELVEPLYIAYERLKAAVKKLAKGDVHVVRMKSRRRPGYEFARQEWQYREGEMLSTFPSCDLACQLAYWMNDTALEHIYEKHNAGVYKCGQGMWCANPTWCHWTNQAVMFPRQWFLDTFSEAIGRFGDRGSWYQNHHALEIECRWNTTSLWRGDSSHRVAISEGIFRHNDIEKYPTLETLAMQ